MSPLLSRLCVRDPRGPRVGLTHLCDPYSPGPALLVQDDKGATSCCLGFAAKGPQPRAVDAKYPHGLRLWSLGCLS